MRSFFSIVKILKVFAISFSLVFSAFAQEKVAPEISVETSFHSEQISSESSLPFSPLNYPSSIHSLIFAGKPISRIESSACLALLKTAIAQGKSFSNKAIKKYITTIDKYPLVEATDLEFFHYTKAIELKELINNKRYDEIFSFLRARGSENVLYVASDPSSSRHFGPIQAKFYFSPSALVFYPKGLTDSSIEATPERLRISTEIQDELIKRYPELAGCMNVGFGNSTGHPHAILTLLAAEAERVSLIAYFGVGNWFQLLGAWDVEDSKIGEGQ